MRIGIIGGGASGCYLAIRLKELKPSFDVTFIEKNDRSKLTPVKGTPPNIGWAF